MVREVYKLVIVFIMVIFSFVLAFFIGQEVALSEQLSNRQNNDFKGKKSFSDEEAKKPKTMVLASNDKEKPSFFFLEGSGEDRFFPKSIKKEKPIIALNENNDKKAPGLNKTELSILNNKQQGEEQNNPSNLNLKKEKMLAKKVNKRDKTLIFKKGMNRKELPLLKTQGAKIKKPEIYGIFLSRHGTKQGAMERASQIKLSFPRWKVFFKKSSNIYKVYLGPFKVRSEGEIFLIQVKKEKKFKKARIENLFVRKQSKKKLAGKFSI